jgi:hypothetical protein
MSGKRRVILYIEVIAQILGMVGAILLWSAFQCKNTKKLFFLQLLSSAFFSLHFFMLGAYTGLLLNSAEVLRSFFLYKGQEKWASHKITMIAVMVMMAACGAVSWDGWLSLLPTAAMVVGTYFLWSRNGKILRFAQLFFISPCWLVYNIAMFSIAGILTEVVNMISVIVSLIRFGVKELDKTYAA